MQIGGGRASLEAVIRGTLVLALIAACSAPAPTPDRGTQPPAPVPVVSPPTVPAIPITPFPEPPQQQAAWTPPRIKLDASVTAAVIRMFAQGVADPRGCEYREIEIEVTAGEEDAATRVKTHGWVLPGTKFAIAWNGLTYQTQSIGAPAELAADMRATLDAHRKATAEAKRETPGYEFYLHASTDEGHYVQTVTLAPGKAMLLLRLGEVALAEAIWAAAIKDQPAYQVLAEDWMWAQFVRGVGAHLRGDVALSIESWRRLPALALTAKTELRNNAYFLADIDALLADAQRRARQPSKPVDLPTIAKLPPAERVARLIDALDQLRVTQFGGQDPIVTALAAEREAAIEPLFVAYETDERRTRSRFVDFKHGDSARYRHVIPVHEIAHDLLQNLIDTSFFEAKAPADGNTTSPAARRDLARQLRAYHAKWRDTSPLMRQYANLADDAADENRWLIAALQITALDASKRLAGESLRIKAPTVTSLFVRRLAGFTDLRQRARMLEAFAVWDPPAAKPHLAKTTREGFAGWAAGEHRGMDPYLGEALTGLITARIAAGDTTALGEYAAWIVTTLPEQAQCAARRWFAPMIANPRAPEVVRAATTLFTSSPWVPLTSKRSGFYMLELLGSDLIHVAAFRDHALSQLTNRTKLGTMTFQRNSINIQTEAFQTGEGIDANDPRAPRAGWTDTLRVNDQYAASLLSGRTGVPVFRRYWPVADRDRALAAIATWLRTQ